MQFPEVTLLFPAVIAHNGTATTNIPDTPDTGSTAYPRAGWNSAVLLDTAKRNGDSGAFCMCCILAERVAGMFLKQA